MNDALAMRFVERVGNLGSNLQRLIERQRPFLEARGERLALEMRHDQVVRAVDAANVVDAADVRMVQRGDRPGLALEAARDRKSPATSVGSTLMSTSRPRRGSWACRRRPCRGAKRDRMVRAESGVRRSLTVLGIVTLLRDIRVGLRRIPPPEEPLEKSRPCPSHRSGREKERRLSAWGQSAAD